jgi:hypothetical protein
MSAMEARELFRQIAEGVAAERAAAIRNIAALRRMAAVAAMAQGSEQLTEIDIPQLLEVCSDALMAATATIESQLESKQPLIELINTLLPAA